MVQLKNSSLLARGFISLSVAVASLAGGLTVNRAGAQTQNASAPSAGVQRALLSRYATDLTQLARLGRLSSSADFEAEVTKVIEALARDTNNSPVLLAEPGSIPAAVARGLARRVAAGQVPARLRDASVYSLSRGALLAGAKTGEEFDARLRAVLAEAAGRRARVVLFMEDLHQYVGSYTERSTSDVTRAAIEGGRLHLVGATTATIYGEYVAKDSGLARLFCPVEVGEGRKGAGEDEGSAAAAGNKLSPELRALAAGAKSAGNRVGVILQADDLRDAKIEATLRRYGVEVDARMAQLGALRVEVPVAALKELASAAGSRYLSPDREIRSFGHVTSTTGTDAVRNGGLVPALLGSTLDGTGIGIAVLDSGMDVAHKAFAAKLDFSGTRLKFKKDFTPEATNADKDPYGHGTHVASAAAGLSPVTGGVYEGVARGADIINLRVLNSDGTGRTSD
ncbi:MAG TPA: S8 family serine peptidase, partial [Pyrinomonadaceae bacterium]